MSICFIKALFHKYFVAMKYRLICKKNYFKHTSIFKYTFSTLIFKNINYSITFAWLELVANPEL